jgi:putative transposase
MFFEYLFFIFKIMFRCITGLFVKRNLELENMLLLKENQILKRKKKRIKFSNIDRFFYMTIYHNYKAIIDKVTLIKPETVLSWHKKLIKRKWNFSKKRQGRPEVSKEIKLLIVEMKKNNSKWGSKRIMGELRKLGIKLCKRTISKILKEYGFDPCKKITSYSWFKFLKSQGKRFFACDFFTIETILMKRLYVFFIIDTETRAIVLFDITSKPCEYFLKNLIRSHFSFMNDLPDTLISDRDGIYGNWFKTFLKDYYNINLIKTPPQMPVCNCFAERMVRTFREDILDHMIIYNENDLYKILKEYVEYYNKKRTHSSLEFNAPLTKFKKMNFFTLKR